MSLQNLRSFIETYRCQSLSAAARNLGLSQPAVSQHIASLEAQLGRKLFDRQARGVAPTGFATDLAAQVGDGLDRAEAALATMRARSTQLSGVVHIAGPAELMAERVAPLLRDLVQAGLEARIHLGGKASVHDALARGDVDLAFTASKPHDRQLATAQLGHERLLAVAGPALSRQIAQAPDFTAAMQAAPFVAYDVDRPLIRQWCAQVGIDLGGAQPVATAPDIRILRSLVEADIGWSVIPDYLCQPAISAGRLCCIPHSAPAIENTIYLVWAKTALRHPRIAHARQLLLDGWAGSQATLSSSEADFAGRPTAS